ncbi:MAG: cobaltochelatase subunit CobN [Pseudomonadota bacterium]
MVISANDAEIAALADAQARLLAADPAAPTLRLSRFDWLAHPYSVDLHLDATLTRARLVVARVLGGEAYWPYGIEQCAARLGPAGVAFAALPGDDREDEGLARVSTLSAGERLALWAYLSETGPENAADFLRLAGHLIGHGQRPPAARPLLRAGVYDPATGGIGDSATLTARRNTGQRDTGQRDVGQRDVGQRNTGKRDTGRRDTDPRDTDPRDTDPRDAGQQDMPRQNTAQQDVGRQNAARQDMGRRDTAQRDTAQRDTAQGDTGQHDAGQGDAGQGDAGQRDAGQGDAGQRDAGRPLAALVFYRALLQGAGLDPVDRLAEALTAEGMDVLAIFVTSLKDPVAAATLDRLFAADPPAVVLNATGFAAGQPGAGPHVPTPLDRPGCPVLQIVFSGGDEAAWANGLHGLGPRDIAMNVALPEVDGRVLARAVSFKGEIRHDSACECPIMGYRARRDRVAFAAALAAGWARLARTPPRARRVALVLANYPTRDGRLANGVGLDTPESAAVILDALGQAGYAVADPPADGAALMARLTAGPTNALDGREARSGGIAWPLAAYRAAFATLPTAVQQAITDRWGAPEDDPFVADGAFRLALHDHGGALVGIQPARGYNIDPETSYHSPDLPPPHGYLAFYLYLRAGWGAHAIVHLGKHGTLEWLPGKALALSETCYPEAVLGPVPHLYPFIVNDPGEGTQAKRRAAAVILDHLTPPLTRAETYGPLADLETLLDEYYEAAVVDRRRRDYLRGEILALVASEKLDLDADVTPHLDPDEAFQRLDNYLCQIKESQIRDGLHVFGVSPQGRLERDLAIALARSPRGDGRDANQSLIRALARDLDIDPDGLDGDLGTVHVGARPAALRAVSDAPWRIVGDTLDRLELLAQRMLDGTAPAPGAQSAAVLAQVRSHILPSLRRCGPAELAALLDGLDGRFVAPGPSGAPTRGRPDVLPTGRNFYSVDTRAVPTPAAWALGWASAEALVQRHLQDQGDWPRAIALTAWGTACMRTGGDDIAQALALMGARPTWDAASRRVTGFEVLPLDVLARPRVDVTLRVSGFFRDAFPAQIDLVDSAARAVMALDEPADQNPAAAQFRAERDRLAAEGTAEPGREAGYRVFGAKPGAYGAGLQALIDERLWERRGDLAETWLDWGGYAYGSGAAGAPARPALARRLSATDAVVQNQDNREHDLLDSDDYYQFEGGMAATVEALTGRAPAVYHNDHSRPERPVIRTLAEEMGRVVRARVVNPKWIAGCRRHGYKGAFEMAATVDYLFAFAATTDAVADHHFDLVHAAYLEDEEVRAFLADANPAALREIAERLAEAIERGLWQPRSNSARDLLATLAP